MKPLLEGARRDLLRDERRLLSDLRVVLVRLEAPAENQKALARAIAQLDELFLLVVVGEFNAGKSAVINALLGQRVLDEGVTPTTSRIGVVMYGPALDRTNAGGVFEVITLPLEVLHEINIVDTPGTNAVLRGHEALTRDFVPRADLVLFVTSADRPFTESERAFLETIRAWGKKVLVAVNKIDILEKPEDIGAVVEFVKEKVFALLGFRPKVFPISAKRALRARTGSDPGLLEASGFPALEQLVRQTLGENVRVRLKLLNPLGVALHVLGEAERDVEDRLGLLKDDLASVEEMARQNALHRDEMARGTKLRLAEIDSGLADLGKRGDAFFEESLRLRRTLYLTNAGQVQADFERTVVAGLPKAVDKRVDEASDWVVAGEARHGHAIAERVERRRVVHAARLGSTARGAFEYDGSALREDLRREAQRALSGYDSRGEALRFAQSARGTAVATVLLEAAAVGLVAGALWVASSASVVTGLLVAAALSAAGLLLLPARRQRAHAQLGAQVAAARKKVAAALTTRLDRELEQNQKRLHEAAAPYTRFVRSEGERMRSQRDELKAQRGGLEALKVKIDALR